MWTYMTHLQTEERKALQGDSKTLLTTLIDEKMSEVLEGRVDNLKENYFEMDISLIRFSLTTECMYIFNFTAYFDRVIRNSVLFVT